MSYPVTFFTTRPPDRASVPSAPTTLMPITQSRAVPNPCRSGPDAFAASTPATVPASPHGGSSGRNCPSRDSSACTTASGTPASTVSVRSAGSCSTMRSSPPVDSATSYACGTLPSAA